MTERELKLKQFLNDYCSKNFNDGKIKLLEAGCGFQSLVHFDRERITTGIDISEKQLERNKTLDERIVGDIQTFPLEANKYDIIVCWDVLEHLPRPDLALKNFRNAIKDNGIIIIGIPNVLSVKGLITKYTPLWFHVLFYKYIFRSNFSTGEDDKGPFKTYLKYSISLPSLRKFARNNNLREVYMDTSDVSEYLKMTNKFFFHVYGVIKKAFKVLSLGKLGNSDLTVVMSKS
jgi:2-polyprenyl-3-methyl-5-hydroxy-6-metoxy-1,4-benzoquinol methylase